MRRLLLRTSVAVCLASTSSCGAPAAPPGTYAIQRDGIPVRGQPFLRYATTDSLGRSITFYISEPGPETVPLPLLVYVQGSSPASIWTETDGRIRGTSGQNTVFDVLEGRARLLVVEKPGAEFLQGPTADGLPPATLRREHTLARWSEAVRAAVVAASSLPTIDASRVLVAGHSEGGIVAARVARLDPSVTHVALLAGGGPTQLYDLVELARAGTFFRRISGDDPEARVAYVLERWKQIQAYPAAADSIFFGHSFRRWYSFLSTSPVEELEHTDARVYLAQGLDDDAVRPETIYMACAEMRARRRSGDVRCDAVPHADHSFALTDGSGTDGWAAVWTRIIDWFLDS